MAKNSVCDRFNPTTSVQNVSKCSEMEHKLIDGAFPSSLLCLCRFPAPPLVRRRESVHGDEHNTGENAIALAKLLVA
jgi:hypothetical protein